MPADQVKITPLTYQRSAQQSDDDIVVKLMAGRLEGDLADYVIDYLSVSRGAAHERLALVTSCRRENVIAYLEMLRAAGLEVESLEVGPTALRRLVVAMSKQDHAQNVLVLNFGLESSYLTIISHGRLLLDQQIDFGEQSLVQSIASQLDLSEELARRFALTRGFETESTEAALGAELAHVIGSDNPLVDIVRPQFKKLMNEIQRAYRYTAAETRGGPIEKVYFFGGLARWRGTARLLEEIVGLPSETMPDLLSLFAPESDAKSSGESPELAVATGLALRGMPDDD